jgi:gamma-polyglutamate synthase
MLKRMNLSSILESSTAPQLRYAMADLRDEVLADAGFANAATDETRVTALIQWTQGQFENIAQLHEMAAEFDTRFRNADNNDDRNAAILDLAWRLGARGRKLERDRKALRQYFDADAVMERYRRRVGERERAAAYGLERSGDLLVAALSLGSIAGDAALIGNAFSPLLSQARKYKGDARVRCASYRCLLQVAAQAKGALSGFWVDITLRDIRRVALNPAEDAWSQCDAMAVLRLMSPVSLEAVLERRLAPNADDETDTIRDNRLFFRRYLAGMLADTVPQYPKLLPYLKRLAQDKSGAVRQSVALSLPRMPDASSRSIYYALRLDRDPQVRAALFVSAAATVNIIGADRYLRRLIRAYGRENDEFVLRLALNAAEEFARWIIENDEPQLPAITAQLRSAIAALRKRTDDLKVRRWAGMTSETLWMLNDPDARNIATEIAGAIAHLHEGEGRRLPALRGYDDDLIGRVLAVLAGKDFGFDYSPGLLPYVRRGNRFKRRAWRFLYEIRLSSTDKRQAWLHTIGRIWDGPIAAPPAHMGELAPTKVPGEPLFQSSEAGWRNYIPLLDHVLSAIDRGGKIQLYTSEGKTSIDAPAGFFRRIKAFWQISWNFAQLAALRNEANNGYITALRRYGVSVSYEPYANQASGAGNDNRDDNLDPQVARFFSIGGIFSALPVIWDDAVTYFSALYQNSVPQLAVFVAAVSAWFFGRHLWRGLRMRHMRGRIPLVLGGWGTRGKSGTERLKAGLINALGLPLVSKTTGCEAMFLHGTAFGDLREMFLFRPYDKATIWEQYDLIGITRGLKARAFLWECMGLTPSYVRVLQRDWMRDDISTITNTYPDHEDVQGPAGRNIPEVMTQFIPEKGILLTTEEEMLPILRQGAMEVQTRIRPIGWKEAGMIHEDLLKRFPYAEHPFNIALVTAMADEMGLPHDYAVKEMADRVVADLGVLKIYPRTHINGRTLEYVMGNSANERFGAMGNWQRMGFEAHDVGIDPEIYISTVVNNRADRVPRSQVFARILAEDISADRHILIGSNIDGLLGFIEDAWLEYAKTLTLFGEEDDPVAKWESLARRARIPLDAGQIAGRLSAMLGDDAAAFDCAQGVMMASADDMTAALGKTGTRVGAQYADEISAHIFEQKAQLNEYERLRGDITGGGNTAKIDDDMRAFLRKVFMAKIVPVHDYYMPGDDIVRLCARHTPPGLINRIMGMQNIKGTGLDFVYRWQAWESCYKACNQALDSDPGIQRRGIDFLTAFQEYGALSDGYVRATIASIKQNNAAGSISEAALDTIISRLDTQLALLTQTGEKGGGSGGSGGRIIEWLESFFDSTDAVLRRRKSEKIYRAMIAEQISSQRAALELKKLTSRQKGGWLSAAISGWKLPWRK